MINDSTTSSLIRCPLQVQASAYPDRYALIDRHYGFTYAHLEGLIEHFSHKLNALGVRCGSKVAIYAKEDWCYVAVLLALWRMGGIAIPLNTRHPLTRVGEWLQEISADRLIVDSTFVNRAPRGIPVIFRDHLCRIAVERPRTVRWQSLVHPATILFTSGSTDRPRAVLHTYGNHYFSALGANMNMPLGPGDRWLLALPLYHVGGLAILFRAFISGATVVFAHREKSLFRQLQRQEITHLSVVPTQLRRLLEEGKEAPAALKAVLVGGSAVSEDLIREAQALNWPIYLTYGLTEMASQVTTTAAPVEDVLSSGSVLPFRAVEIAADGEILVKGDTLFRGYVRGSEVIASVDEHGWYHTGDVGYIDESGQLHVIGRKDNMFISGGENIYPEVIERVLEDLPAVAEVVVVAVPDAEFGHRPAAIVRWKNHPLTLEEIRAQVANRLARYELPVALFPWPERVEATFKIHRPFFQAYAEQLWMQESYG